MKVKLAFGPHPTEPALLVMQVCMDGMWYDLPGYTVHNTNDKLKAIYLKAAEEVVKKKGYTLCK